MTFLLPLLPLAQHGPFATLGDSWEMVLRLLVAATVGALVGLEREVRGRQAGFRTCLLVCLGSCLVMIVSGSMAALPWTPAAGADYKIQIDPSRIAYGVMTGVGFLGAGTIIQNRGSVRGLTTAAGVWSLAAVGLAIGAGFYTISLAASALILIALWLLNYLEHALPRTHFRDVTLQTPYRPGCVSEATNEAESLGIRVVGVSFRREGDLTMAEIKMRLSFLKLDKFDAFERRLSDEHQFEFVSAREG